MDLALDNANPSQTETARPNSKTSLDFLSEPPQAVTVLINSPEHELTDENLTKNVLLVVILSLQRLCGRNHNPTNLTSNTANTTTLNNIPRLTYLLHRLITHLHAFILETRLTPSELHSTITFLTQTGQNCTSTRQEFILLSDVLGVSALVESISTPRLENPFTKLKTTPGTILGPFHRHDSQELPNGSSISSSQSLLDPESEKLLFLGKVLDIDHQSSTGTINIDPFTDKTPGIQNCTISIWEADSHGLYDAQYPSSSLSNPPPTDHRATIHTTEAGTFTFTCVKPAPYAIPTSGPVGSFLALTGRTVYRPAHIHFLLSKPGYQSLTTQLYLQGDKYEKADAVFAVKKELVVPVTREVVDGEEVWVMKYVFWLAKCERVNEAMKEGRVEVRVEIDLEGLPVLEVD